MPVYHSTFNDGEYRTVGNLPLLPIKTKLRGPAPTAEESAEDAIDEAINVFRANCLFRNFEIKGGGDRVLIYLLLFIQECLLKLGAKNPGLAEGTRNLTAHAMASFVIPGEPSFPLNAMYSIPANRGDQDTCRQYLAQLRQETALRLAPRVYDNDKPSKWWMCFSKRKFMNLSGITGA